MSLDASSSLDDTRSGRPQGTTDATSYLVPRYRAEQAAFYHVLHGNVPGHQIDFMYLPEVPQGALRQTHVGHLARLIKYIEPRDSAAYAFAIGNLSRDDVQHKPGHGGLAILFALRVPGVVDHAGRDTPPYAHAVLAVDRHLDYTTLLEATTTLYRRFLEREGAEDRRGDFYRSYVRTVRESPDHVPDFLARAIAEHDDLPSPRKSTLSWDYAVDDVDSPRQIAIVHDEPMDFGTLAHWASTLGALLYRSNIKWTTVSTGREMDIVGGTSIRFVPRSEAQGGVSGSTFELDDLPDDDDSLARLLFGAKRRGMAAPAPAQGWREAMAAQRGVRSEPPPPDRSVSVDVDDAAATIPVASPLDASRGFDPRRSSPVSGQAVARVAIPGVGGASFPGSPAGGAPVAESATSGAGGGVLSPAIEPVTTPPRSLAADTAHADGAFPQPRADASNQRGKLVIAGAVLAAIAVVVVVAVAVGMGASEGGASSGSSTVISSSGSDQGTTTPPGATIPPVTASASATPSLPAPTASAAPSAPTTGTSTPSPKGSSTSTGAPIKTAKPPVKIKPPVF